MPNSLHSVKEERKIMMRNQYRGVHLAGLIKMPQIAARISPADRARAVGIERLASSDANFAFRIFSFPRDVNAPPVRPLRVGITQSNISTPRLTASTGPRACRHPSDTAGCQPAFAAPGIRDVVHHRLFLADAQSADGVAVKADLDGPFETFFSQIQMSGTLNDAEQCLPVRLKERCHLPNAIRTKSPNRHRLPVICRTAPSNAAPSARSALDSSALRRCRVARRAFVESHHDLGAKRGLNLHRDFGRKKLLAAVEMRAKFDAFFGQFSKIGQRKHLKSARIGQKRAVPGRKFMQPAEIVG